MNKTFYLFYVEYDKPVRVYPEPSQACDDWISKAEIPGYLDAYGGVWGEGEEEAKQKALEMYSGLY